MSDVSTPTWVTGDDSPHGALNVRRCRLSVVSGPDIGKSEQLALETIQIGRVGADFTITDKKASGLHCEIQLRPDGYRVRDLDSTNGTYVRNVRIVDAFLTPGSTLQMGRTVIQFDPMVDSFEVPLWREPRFHRLIGTSSGMRRLFEQIHRFAQSDATILIHGETGTGKELVADAVHRSSQRAGPLVVFDCSAVPEELFEAQLFGYEPGAFTGAVKATPGVFEMAHGGTLFLDEIGELPLLMQAKLLRAVETRKVQRLGSSRVFAADIRIVAATNRDLASEVNRGTFRSDLYYRLAVLRLVVPALRTRRDDIPMLVDHFLHLATTGWKMGSPTLPDDFIARARRHSWPGNVRELRNAVERALLLPNDAAVELGGITASSSPEIDIDVPFHLAKQEWMDDFDRGYIRALLERHGGNVSAVARAAGIERLTIYNILRRLASQDEKKE
jgi:two-component system response regulator GlrR